MLGKRKKVRYVLHHFYHSILIYGLCYDKYMYLSAIITVAILHFLAVISQGPDFIMITRNALIYSRRSGVYAAIGLALGILVHITYSLWTLRGINTYFTKQNSCLGRKELKNWRYLLFSLL